MQHYITPPLQGAQGEILSGGAEFLPMPLTVCIVCKLCKYYHNDHHDFCRLRKPFCPDVMGLWFIQISVSLVSSLKVFNRQVHIYLKCFSCYSIPPARFHLDAPVHMFRFMGRRPYLSAIV